MSKVPPNQDSLSEVDQLYRRLSALDQGRPGEWVRRKVQAYATQHAAERAVRANAKAKEISSSEAPTPRAAAIPAATEEAAKKSWLLPVTIGAVAAAALVGFLVVPRLMGPGDTPKAAVSSAPAPEPATAAPQIAQTPEPSSSESAPSGSESPATTSPPSQSSAPATTGSPPPVAQSSAPAAPGSPPPVAQSPTASAAAVAAVASHPAATPPTQSPTRTRVARQNAPSSQGAPAAIDHADTATQAARPAPTADSATAPKPAPSADTQVASAAPPPPAPAPAPATQPASTPAGAASAPPDALWEAAKSGDVSGLQAAFASNVDVNAPDANGETALILAIQNNRVEAVQVLLAHGANPNTADARGRTPLRAARVRGNLAILMALEHTGKH